MGLFLMNTFIRSVVFVGALACASGATAQASLERATVPGSDPSRPGEISVRLVNGSISVESGTTNEVVVEVFPGTSRSRDRGETSDNRRRLSQSAALAVEERNNRVEIGTRQPNVAVHLQWGDRRS
jgi:hypothetical protein